MGDVQNVRECPACGARAELAADLPLVACLACGWSLRAETIPASIATPIDRSSPLWRDLYFEAWKQMLSRVSAGDQVIQAAAIAREAASIADDAAREAFGMGSAPACIPCSGVGCVLCSFTGRTLPSAIRPVPVREQAEVCRACDGSGKIGTMSEGGNVQRGIEPCGKCGGSGVYRRNLNVQTFPTTQE